ncbi:Unknown protein [Striga hermonthica]|uniref:Uncharacterized protein n=1 Tax=Striga hermonthica TaxID=68872 RepID=A0A9N7RS28_STRHE|nr:Unknown protein [Striga hermonthica]
MSDELCLSKAHFSSLLISGLVNFCNFIFSEPLYFCYFVFFSPYLLKLVSFLSPLFLTTFLLSVAAGIVQEKISVTVSRDPLSENDFGGDGFEGTDDLGIYEVLFGTRLLFEENEKPSKIPEEKIEESPGSGVKCRSFSQKKGVFEAKMIEQNNPNPVFQIKNSCPALEERRLENFLKILQQFEKMSTANADEKKKMGFKMALEGPTDNSITMDNSEDGRKGQNHPPPVVKGHSHRMSCDVSDENNEPKEHIPKADSLRTWGHSNSGSFGSMRKEKEWRRTLACKLFEERHNVDGGEGMDSLWEAYETDSNKSVDPKKKRSKKTSSIEFVEDHEDEDDEDDDVVDGQLCCLQAVKLSAGKMNLGIGRPNLVKISKAIKGFGWLRHVSKHSKKVHDNGDR